MTMIKPYKKCRKCGTFIVSGTLCEDCKPITNADRIRQMTDEELADFFCQISQCCLNDAGCSMCPIYDGCAQNVMCVETWLKQEVSEDAGNARNAAHELRDICERLKTMGIPAKPWSALFVHVRKAAEDLDELADVLYGLADVLYGLDDAEDEETEGLCND